MSFGGAAACQLVLWPFRLMFSTAVQTDVLNRLPFAALFHSNPFVKSFLDADLEAANLVAWLPLCLMSLCHIALDCVLSQRAQPQVT